MKQESKRVIYMHGGSGNHGCEAIVRTTAKLFGAPSNTVLWSQNREEDEKYDVTKCFEKIVVSEELRKYSRAYFEALIKRKILRNQRANFEVFIKELFRGNIAISVGGDNYCYPWSAKYGAEINKEIRKHAAKTVLWACSFEEQFLTPEVKEDLSKYDWITAREQLSYNTLKNYNSNVIKVSDPAFLLEKEELPLPEGFVEGNTVGINISPLINEYGSEETILENYEELIRFFIRETDMNICLIPHVVRNKNNDALINDKLYDLYHNSGRVTKINDCSCRQLKGYIARCRMFIGARTHATIAAYSSLVPTLVVGYSVKSKGIARDLFGTDEGYVVPVQALSGRNDLVKAVKQILLSEDSIRKQLTERMPSYLEEAKAAAFFAHLND